MDSSQFSDPCAPALYLVPGLAGGREFFLGEPVDGAARSCLAGKVVSLTDDGRIVIRPHRTTLMVDTIVGGREAHRLDDRVIQEEARALLESSATHIPEEAVPRLRRWLDAARAGRESQERERTLGIEIAPTDSVAERHAAFRSNARAIRRLLLATPHLHSGRELDRITELEADLLLELGKVVNRLSWRWNELISGVPELRARAEDETTGAEPVRDASSGGWRELWAALQESLAWARARGRAELLADLNSLLREGLITSHGILSDHAAALDGLIAESLAEYGIECAWELVPPANRAAGDLPRTIFPRLHTVARPTGEPLAT